LNDSEAEAAEDEEIEMSDEEIERLKKLIESIPGEPDPAKPIVPPGGCPTAL